MMKSKMAKKDLETFVKEADADNDGLIDCKGKKKSIFLKNSPGPYFRVLFILVQRCLNREGEGPNKC